MKSTPILLGMLASIGTAQPHSPHRHVHRQPAAYPDDVHKRDIETVWVTQWQTVSWTESIGQSTTEFWSPAGESMPPAPTDSFPPVSTTASSSAETEAAAFFDSSISVAQPSPTSTSATSPPDDNVSPTTLSPVVVPTPAAPSTTQSSVTPAASTAPSSNSGSSGGYTFSGDLTFYTLGVGSCGIDDTGKDNSAYVVAVAADIMSTFTGNPNQNPNCGRTVEISYGGVTAQATVVDTCEGCQGDSLDASQCLFDKFANPSQGRLSGMQWKWLD